MSTASVPKMDISCPQCGANFKVPVSVAGKKGRCARCQTTIPIPLAPPPADAILDAEVIEASVMPASPMLAPLGPSGLEPIDASHGLTPLPPTQSSFDDAFGDYKLMNEAPAMTSLPPASPYQSPAYAPDPYAPQVPAKNYDGAFGMEKRFLDAGMLGGLGLMLLAVVWFVGGLMFDYIFFYPPILFIIGLASCIKSLFR